MKIGPHIYFIIKNRIWFRRMGIKYGTNMKVYNRLYVEKAATAQVTIGDNFSFVSEGGYNPITSNIRGYIRLDDNAQLSIGDNCGMSSATLWVKKALSIGKNVLIGGGTLIMDTDCHSLDWRLRGRRGGYDEQGRSIDSLNAKSSPVVIEDDVLIGARSIILKGVTIGARSVIGAGSVVSQDVPSDCIAVGNPCKVVKKIE